MKNLEALNMPVQQIDACGLQCPLPLLRAKRALNKLSEGQVIEVLATDPGSVPDFEAFAIQTKNKLFKWYKKDQIFHFFLIKKSTSPISS